MRIKSETRKLFNNMRIMLRQVCHADGCTTLRKCPNQCQCRNERTFRLNTETAICWELADKIWEIFGQNKMPLKSEIKRLIEHASAYNDLSRFHMSKGWQRFFERVHRSMRVIAEDSEWPSNSEQTIKDLRVISKRLKRFPR